MFIYIPSDLSRQLRDPLSFLIDIYSSPNQTTRAFYKRLYKKNSAAVKAPIAQCVKTVIAKILAYNASTLIHALRGNVISASSIDMHSLPFALWSVSALSSETIVSSPSGSREAWTRVRFMWMGAATKTESAK